MSTSELNFVLLAFKLAMKIRDANNVIFTLLKKERKIVSKICSPDLIELLKTNTVKKRK